MTTPTYLCQSATCRHRFQLPAPKVTGCIQCGHPYVQWLTFDAWFRAPGKTAAYTAVYGRDGAR